MKLKVLPKNIEVDVDSNKTVLEISRELGLGIQSSCNGICNCGDCKVIIKEGESNVFLPTDKELKLIGEGYYLDQRRLACQLQCFGDVVLDLSEQEERAEQGKISKSFLKRAQKKSRQESHSKDDILIQENINLKKKH